MGELKQNMIYTYNEVLLSLENDGNPGTCVTAWMNLEDIVLSEMFD